MAPTTTTTPFSSRVAECPLGDVPYEFWPQILPHMDRASISTLMQTSAAMHALVLDYLEMYHSFPCPDLQKLPTNPIYFGGILNSCLFSSPNEKSLISLAAFQKGVVEAWKRAEFDPSRLPERPLPFTSLALLQEIAERERSLRSFACENKLISHVAKKLEPPQYGSVNWGLPKIRDFLNDPETLPAIHRVTELDFRLSHSRLQAKVVEFPLELELFENVQVFHCFSLSFEKLLRFPHLPNLKILSLAGSKIGEFLNASDSKGQNRQLPSLEKLYLCAATWDRLIIAPHMPQTALFYLCINQVRALETESSVKGTRMSFACSRDFIPIAPEEIPYLLEVVAFLKSQAEGQVPTGSLSAFYVELLQMAPQEAEKFLALLPEEALVKWNALPEEVQGKICAKEQREAFDFAKLLSAAHKALIRETLESYDRALDSKEVNKELWERFGNQLSSNALFDVSAEQSDQERWHYQTLVVAERLGLPHRKEMLNLLKLSSALDAYEARQSALPASSSSC